MIKDIFPRSHQRYLSLTLLGSILDDFSEFLVKLGYTPRIIRYRMLAIYEIDHRLKQLGCHSIKRITRKKLLACAPSPGHAKDNANAAATVNLLSGFFYEKNIFHEPKQNLLEQKVFNYRSYLKKTRGLAPSTINIHCSTVLQFLFYLKKRRKFPGLEKLTSRDIENFLCEIGKRVGRGFLQHIVAHLRSFLRFLKIMNEIPLGLGDQIDTPRVYREEKLPRAVPWNIVQALLKSVDRSTAIGKRDYAIFLLVTTYGLRASEIVSLKLDNINWRTNTLNIFQRKTNKTLVLPLTIAVGRSILDYLQKGHSSVPYREIFIKNKSPIKVLKASSINNIVHHWNRQSGLSIPVRSIHWLRHSYAIHLLQQGTSLKTIADILGHQSFESTCVYLRLNVDALREVPLSFPRLSTQRSMLL